MPPSPQPPVRPPHDDVAANQTYAHLVARWLVRPLVGTRVRPNHLTSLRIVVGLAATALLTLGSERAYFASGALWIIACVLDRADGELARMADLRSDFGKRLDYHADLILDAAWFLGAGIGLRHGRLDALGPALGILCCGSMVVVQWAGELFERHSATGVRVWGSVKRFHPDDGLFLLGFFPSAGLLAPVLIGSSVVLPVVAVATLMRYRALRARALQDAQLRSAASGVPRRRRAAASVEHLQASANDREDPSPLAERSSVPQSSRTTQDRRLIARQ